MANPFNAMEFGFLKDNGIDTKDMSVQEAIDKYQEMNKHNGNKTENEVPQSSAGRHRVVELDKDNELSKLILASNQSKYKTIKQYLIKNIIFTIFSQRNKKKHRPPYSRCVAVT